MSESTKQKSGPVVPNRMVADYLRTQRSNPYYTVFTILFAALVAIDSEWIVRIVRDSLPKNEPYEEAALSEIVDKLDVVVNRVIVETPFQQTLFEQVALAVLVFLLVVYLWLFFSRILVYVSENATGEALSFLLLATLLVGVSVLTVVPKLWFLIVSGVGFIITVKMLHVFISLKNQKGHPIRVAGMRWTVISLIVTILTPLIAFVFTPGLFMRKTAEVEHLDALYGGLLTVLVAGGVTAVAFVFPRIERWVVSEMNVYIAKTEFEGQPDVAADASNGR